MQNTSTLYNRLIASENHYFETKVVIECTDGDHTYNEDVLFSVETDSRVFSEDNPTVGGALSSEIDIKMLEPLEIIPKMARICPYIRVCGIIESEYAWDFIDGVFIFHGGVTIDGNSVLTFAEETGARITNNILYLPDQTTGTESEWIPKGIYYIDTRYVTRNDDGLNVLTIHGYDDMLKFEMLYPSDDQHDYPMTDIDMVEFIASSINIDLDDRTVQAMTKGYQFPLMVGYSSREVLGIIAASYGGNFVISEQGKLLLLTLSSLPVDTNYLIDEAGNRLVIGEDRIIL